MDSVWRSIAGRTGAVNVSPVRTDGEGQTGGVGLSGILRWCKQPVLLNQIAPDAVCPCWTRYAVWP